MGQSRTDRAIPDFVIPVWYCRGVVYCERARCTAGFVLRVDAWVPEKSVQWGCMVSGKSTVGVWGVPGKSAKEKWGGVQRGVLSAGE
eukprot:1032741-Rhodomonas_salina.1